MRNLNRRFLTRLLSTILIVYLLLSISLISYAKDDEIRVLFISSYSASFPSIPEQIDGIQSVFSDKDILFDIEFMDTKRLYTEETFQNFYNTLAYKLDQLESYDLILVGDDNGLQFVLDYREELFSDIPVVFFAVNSIERTQIAGEDDLMTGVVEALSIKETIDIAMNLNPEARQVLAITDNTVTGQAGISTYNEISIDYPEYTFESLNSEDYTYLEIDNILDKLDNQTILLYLAMFKDKTGESNTIYESAAMLNEMSPVPVYVPYSNGVGQGFFGGKVVYHYEQGRLAAQIALDIISGQSIQEISLVLESPNKYFFDYAIVEELGMDDSLFPESTIFLNKEISFFDQYQSLIWTVTTIIISLLLGIFILLINIGKRRKAEGNLFLAYEELTGVTEELMSQEEELRHNFNELITSEKELTKSKERYSLVFSASAEGLWDYDYVKEITFMSGEWHNKFIKIKELSAWHEIVYEEDREFYFKLIDEVVMGKKYKYNCEYRVVDIQGNIRWIHEKAIASHDDQGHLTRIVGSHIDISNKKERENRIKELAYFDVLTNLPNRVSLYDEFEKLLQVSLENNKDGAVFFIDVDNFKYVNDTFGHGIGDQLLQEIGIRLKGLVEEEIHVYRLGGDEFVIVFEHVSTTAKINEMASMIQDIISNPIFIDNYTFNMTTSIGIALYPENGSGVEDLLKNADVAMYKAKESGRNQSTYFDNVMNVEIYDRMVIQNSIRQALERKEFQLYYQPIINAKTESIVGFEALIRWFSKENGYIPPDRLIKVAEEMGIIVEMGKWIFKTACEFSLKINKDRKIPLSITINVSPVQMVQKDFVKVIKDIVAETGVNPHHIGIELTETAMMESFEDNREKLRKLKESGFSIYLDDFGTGYSSLNYLRELPIDSLKIDKTFIDDLIDDDDHTNLTSDIIMIAHKVGLKVVAEGVEEKRQYEKLVNMECDKIQGYYFSKPVNGDTAIDMV